MTRKKRLTMERHREIGRELKTMRERLVTLSVEICNAYPVGSKTYRHAVKIYREIDELRSALDDEVFRENPGGGIELADVYYPV